MISERRKKFRLFIILVGIAILFILVIIGVSKNREQRMVNDYLKTTKAEEFNQLCDNEVIYNNSECYSWYEKNMLGLSNNFALAGLSRNVNVNKKYMNKLGNYTAYRNRKKGTLTVKQMDDDIVFCGKNSVGEIILSEEKVYFINETKKNALAMYDVSEKKVHTLVKKDVHKFAVLGHILIYLTNQGLLKYYDVNNGESVELATNIQGFYIVGNIIAQNESQIISITPDGRKMKKLIKNAIVLGANKNLIYYTLFDNKEKTEGISQNEEKNAKIGEYKVYSYDLNTRKSKFIDSRDRFVRAVYDTEKGPVLDTVQK